MEKLKAPAYIGCLCLTDKKQHGTPVISGFQRVSVADIFRHAFCKCLKVSAYRAFCLDTFCHFRKTQFVYLDKSQSIDCQRFNLLSVYDCLKLFHAETRVNRALQLFTVAYFLDMTNYVTN